MSPLESCTIEANRFFKKYYQFCKSSDSDNLREVLFSLYSLDDKLRKSDFTGFHPDNDFLALKALRNYATHESELLNESKAIATNRMTNVMAEAQIICLLPKKTIHKIKKGLKSKLTKNCIDKSFVEYNKYFDIYPSIFNIAVKVYFKIKECNLIITCNEFGKMQSSIDYEKANGISHFISGKIKMADGSSIDEYLEKYLVSIDQKISEMESLETDENGHHSFISSRCFTDEEKEIMESPESLQDFIDKLVDDEKVIFIEIPGEKPFFLKNKALSSFEDHLISKINIMSGMQ